MLLLTMTLLVAAAGYYYLSGSSQQVSPTPPSTADKTFAIPPRPIPSEVPPPLPLLDSPVLDLPAKQPIAAKTTKPAAKPEEIVPLPKNRVPLQKKKAPTPGIKYEVRVGAFANKSILNEALNKIRRLGFSPRVERVRRPILMTRLRIGVYPPKEAREKLNELKKTVAGAFVLKRGENLGLYAASLRDTDEIQKAIKELADKGIKVEREQVSPEIILSRLSFGTFSSMGAAQKEASRAKASGFETKIVKLPNG